MMLSFHITEGNVYFFILAIVKVIIANVDF